MLLEIFKIEEVAFAYSLWWKFQKDGKFIVKVCYRNFWGIWEAFKRTGHGEQFGRHLFHLDRYPRSLFSAAASRCFLCESARECVNHLLLHCTFTRKIWTMFRAIFGV